MDVPDYHLHTADSADSEASMMRMVGRAAELGLPEICFTEHYDVDPYDPGYGYYDDRRYERRLAAARRRYGERVAVRKGLEFDFQSRHADRLADRLRPWRFDFLIGSVHCIYGTMVRETLERRGFPVEEVYAEYFVELQALVATGLPHVLGHLDYVRKVAADLVGPESAWPGYWDAMADLVEQLVGAGVGLEVNTRHLRRGQPIVPSEAVLRMYREAGGRVVTLGSDAHSPAELGRGLDEAVRMLRRVGFAEVTVFRDGRPEWRSLPTVS